MFHFLFVKLIRFTIQHVASVQYMDFVEIVCETDKKDSDDYLFVDLDGAKVEELVVLWNLRIKDDNS